MIPTARYMLTTLLTTLTLAFSPLLMSEEEKKEPASPESSQDSGEYLSHVPNLVGMDLAKVRKTLPDYLLKLGNVTEIPSQSPKNTVITQSVPAFSDVKQQTAINLTVSSGSLSLKDLKIDTVATPPETAPAPVVKEVKEETAIPPASTTPESNTTTQIPTPEPIIVEETTTTKADNETDKPTPTFLNFVPDLTGMTKDQASKLLPQHNLILGEVSERPSDKKAGTIIAQIKKANTDIPQNSIVHITVAATENNESTAETNSDTPLPLADMETEKAEDQTAKTNADALTPAPVSTETTNITADDQAKEASPTTASDSPANKADNETASTTTLRNDEKQNDVTTSENKETDNNANPTIVEKTEDKETNDTADENKETASTLTSTINEDSEAATPDKTQDTNKADDTGEEISPESRAQVTIEAEKGLQSKREIIFSITPPKSLQNEATLNYHLSIAGKI